MELITFNDKKYPAFQANGNASKYVMPFALEFCKGIGFDVGYNRDEWKLIDSIGVDIANDPPYHALNLPYQFQKYDNIKVPIKYSNRNESIPIYSCSKVNYIFSSHCLEHIDDWVATLIYWQTRLKRNGIIFLYLPDYSQEYWRPWYNIKHKHMFTPVVMKDYFNSRSDLKNLFISGVDLNNSFTVVAEF